MTQEETFPVQKTIDASVRDTPDKSISVLKQSSTGLRGIYGWLLQNLKEMIKLVGDI